ncbi:MAG: hypothetical protein JWL72_1905 [Ilumatobacteraceae bacterium]|nr:hypothetical protein [Ilumatobacteraceae bacterium]
MRSRFTGEICGFGTASGHRVIVGRWVESPLGAFTDVMHEAPDGFRMLLAPNAAVAEFVSATYTFDEIRILPVISVRTADGLHLDAGTIVADVEFGGRTATGWLLRCVPRPLARAPWWCTAIDPVARVVMRGVRTRGTAGNGRREFYGATDAHRVESVACRIAGADAGALADVWPPVRFGFGSTPRVPMVVAVTTTIIET